MSRLGRRQPEPPIRIRDIASEDLEDLRAIAPPEWGDGMALAISQHLGRPNYLARVAVDEVGVCAMAQGIINGKNGWLGNVIVRPDRRGHGLGTRMTTEVVQRLHAIGCRSVTLIATEMGAPVYRKLGFRIAGQYEYLRVPRTGTPMPSAVRRVSPGVAEQALVLDRLASGECRREVISPHLEQGWCHADSCGNLKGLYLPTFGRGAVVASSIAAGCTLLEAKLSKEGGQVVVPTENNAALRFLSSFGAETEETEPRMVLGEDPPWRPTWQFSVGTGYCG